MVHEIMMTDHEIGYYNEFLQRLCLTDADRKDATQLIDTVRALFVVLAIAKKLINKTPSHYSPTSRKGELQEAIKPFYKTTVKEPHD